MERLTPNPHIKEMKQKKKQKKIPLRNWALIEMYLARMEKNSAVMRKMTEELIKANSN